MIEDAVDFIVRLSSDTYESLLYQMSVKQRDVFLAIASEKSAREVTGSRFIKSMDWFLRAAYLPQSNPCLTRTS